MIHPKDDGLVGKTVAHYKIIEKIGSGSNLSREAMKDTLE